jgi:hypothetical protein
MIQIRRVIADLTAAKSRPIRLLQLAAVIVIAGIRAAVTTAGNG